MQMYTAIMIVLHMIVLTPNMTTIFFDDFLGFFSFFFLMTFKDLEIKSINLNIFCISLYYCLWSQHWNPSLLELFTPVQSALPHNHSHEQGYVNLLSFGFISLASSYFYKLLISTSNLFYLIKQITLNK